MFLGGKGFRARIYEISMHRNVWRSSFFPLGSRIEREGSNAEEDIARRFHKQIRDCISGIALGAREKRDEKDLSERRSSPSSSVGWYRAILLSDAPLRVVYATRGSFAIPCHRRCVEDTQRSS